MMLSLAKPAKPKVALRAPGIPLRRKRILSRSQHDVNPYRTGLTSHCELMCLGCGGAALFLLRLNTRFLAINVSV